MEACLTGPPTDSEAFAVTLVTSDFYQIVNRQRLEYKTYVQGLADWRGKTSEYRPLVKEFLRDSDRLAAYMTGSIKLEGTPNEFEILRRSLLMGGWSG